jgi:hypothetical protein
MKLFLRLKYRLNFLLAQGNWQKCANKMLVKLTTGVDFLCQQASSYLNKGKAAAVEGNIN